MQRVHSQYELEGSSPCNPPTMILQAERCFLGTKLQGTGEPLQCHPIRLLLGPKVQGARGCTPCHYSNRGELGHFKWRRAWWLDSLRRECRMGWNRKDDGIQEHGKSESTGVHCQWAVKLRQGLQPTMAFSTSLLCPLTTTQSVSRWHVGLGFFFKIYLFERDRAWAWTGER